MNVLDKLSILSAMINCAECGNCVAKAIANTYEREITLLKLSMM